MAAEIVDTYSSNFHNDILGEKICNSTHTYYIGKFFTGSNYLIHSLCEDKTQNKCEESLVKIYKLYKRGGHTKIKNVEKEYLFMDKAFSLGVSPEVISVDFCYFKDKYELKKEKRGKELTTEPNYGLISLKKYGEGTINNLYLENKELFNEHKLDIKKKIRDILDKLYENNISHNDLHAKNFLYKFKNNIIEIKIIDFDLSTNTVTDKKYDIDFLNKNDQTIFILSV
jgi:serine/threonine protein kinase